METINKECKNKCEKYDKPKFYSICEMCNNIFCDNCMYLICCVCYKQYTCFHCGSQERNKSFITGIIYVIKCHTHKNFEEQLN